MRSNDARNAERARFSKNSAKNCRVFGAENLKHRRSKRRNSVPKYLLRSLTAMHDGMKTGEVCTCDFFGCATASARGRRIFREKLQSFRRQKFEKSMPQMEKIGCRKLCANFKKQRTVNKRANAIERSRKYRRMPAKGRSHQNSMKFYEIL